MIGDQGLVKEGGFEKLEDAVVVKWTVAQERVKGIHGGSQCTSGVPLCLLSVYLFADRTAIADPGLIRKDWPQAGRRCAHRRPYRHGRITQRFQEVSATRARPGAA